MADTNLSADLNILQNAPIEIELIDDDLNIIQKLDDEPNDVGGLTSAELKEHFDRAGNIIKDYINNELIPAVVASDATEQAREAAEAERESAEDERAAAEAVRVEQESARYANEGIRDALEGQRQSAEDARVSAESTRTSNENARVSAETARTNSEANRVSAESARASAETQRSSAETSRASAESTRVSNEQTRTTAEATRISAESARVTAEASRNTAEQARVTAEQARATAETARETFVNGFKSSVESLNGIVKGDGSGNLSAAVEGTDYMGAVNPVGTGSFSMNRKAGTTVGNRSFAEGYNATASGNTSHAEGNNTTASASFSHAEGSATTASNFASHAEGDSTTASGDCSHTEGGITTASGEYSHAEGYFTKATSDYQHTQGKYNVDDTNGVYADIVGWGTADNARKNISSLTTDGDLHLAGDVYVHANDDGTGGTKLGTGGGGGGMAEHKLTYNGTAIQLDGATQTFAQVKSACDDATKFVFLVYENRLYIPQYVTASAIYFTCTYPTDLSGVMTRRITMMSNNTVTVNNTELQPKLTAGSNITIVDNVISAAGGGGGITSTLVFTHEVTEDDSQATSYATTTLPNDIDAYIAFACVVTLPNGFHPDKWVKFHINGTQVSQLMGSNSGNYTRLLGSANKLTGKWHGTFVYGPTADAYVNVPIFTLGQNINPVNVAPITSLSVGSYGAWAQAGVKIEIFGIK